MPKKTETEEMAIAVESEAAIPGIDPHARVKIKLFKDSGDYSEPVFVSVNDYRATIPRGVEVEVPLYVAKVLEESQSRDAIAALRMDAMENDYDKKASAL